MASKVSHNKKNSAVKRIMQEALELAEDPSCDYVAGPLEDDIFEWHATIRGAEGTEFEGGIYHVRIILPPAYPFAAPDMMILTPNGRFEVGKKICIDGLTSFHAGSWQPAWGVRTAIVGLISFWGNKGEALQSVGALNYPVEERKRLAKLSRKWSCAQCEGSNEEHLLAPTRDASLNESPPSVPAPVDSVPLLDSTPSPQTPSNVLGSEHELLQPTVSPLDIPSSPTDPISTPSSSSDLVETSSHLSEDQSPATAPLRVSSRSTAPPLWFDSLFFALILALVVVLARRMI